MKHLTDVMRCETHNARNLRGHLRMLLYSRYIDTAETEDAAVKEALQFNALYGNNWPPRCVS